MKVHVVTSANRALYLPELEEMHRLRHRVFVEDLRWMALASPDGLEVDEFDDDTAVYLIACEEGRVCGSLRLLPTWRRCMITERWPQFARQGEVVTGPGIWEWTRWCPGRLIDRRHLVRARSALIIAALEFARSRCVSTYITFGDRKFFGQIEELGWAPEALGEEMAYDEGVAIAVRWTITPAMLRDARARMRVASPVTIEAPAVETEHETFLRPWMLERLISASIAEDVSAIEKVLGQVSLAAHRPRAAKAMEVH